MNQPFTPFQHLLCCLPASSATALPSSYQSLMTDSSSPIYPYMSTEYASDMNGKVMEYEAVILLPFIPEDIVLKAIEDSHCNDTLTEREKLRNSYEHLLFYYYDNEKVEDLPSPLDPTYFPALQECHVQSEIITEFSQIYQHFNHQEKSGKQAYSSLKPFCSSISRTSSTEATSKTNFTPSLPTTLTIDCPYIFADTPSAMESVGSLYLNKVIDYGFPNHMLGVVTGVTNTHYGCFLQSEQDHSLFVGDNKEKEKDMERRRERKNEDKIVCLPVEKQMVEQVNTILQSLQKKAMASERDASEKGFIDIEKNKMILSIKPFSCITRNPINLNCTPYFAGTQFFYPVCLTQLLEDETDLSSFLPSSHTSLEWKVNQPVIYMSNRKIAEGNLQGCTGIIKEIHDNDLLITVTLPDSVPSLSYEQEQWYTFKELLNLFPTYRRILKSVLHYTYVIYDNKKIIISLNIYPNKQIARSDLVKQQPLRMKRASHIPKISYEVYEKEENCELLFSQKTVSILTSYFKRFGNKLLQGLEIKNNQPSINKEIITNQLATSMQSWVETNVNCFSLDSMNTLHSSSESIDQLEEEQVIPNSQQVEIECSKKDVLIQDPQFCVLPKIIADQDVEKIHIGSRVVVAHHPTIPFGSRGTIVSIETKRLLFDVILDYPCIAGVPMKNATMKTSCIGKRV